MKNKEWFFGIPRDELSDPLSEKIPNQSGVRFFVRVTFGRTKNHFPNLSRRFEF